MHTHLGKYWLILPFYIISLVTALLVAAPISDMRGADLMNLSTVAGQSSSNDNQCIRATMIAHQLFLPALSGAAPSNSVPQSKGLTTIQDVTQDTGGCIKFTGDSIHFTLKVGESRGTATIDIGDVSKGIQLYDDGSHGDSSPADGFYELTYTTTSADIGRTMLITGKFVTETGKEALPAYASGRVTITDWENVEESSVDTVDQVAEDLNSGARYAAERLVLTLNDSASHDEIVALLAQHNLTLASWLPKLMAFEIQLTGDQEYESLRQQLIGSPIVSEVGRNIALNLFGPSTEVKDFFLPLQADYLNPIRAKLGWTITQGDPTIIVAVIDTGVNQEHPDLKSQVDKYIICPICDFDDLAGHGTFVSGVIAAERGLTGISGVAPEVSLQVFKYNFWNKLFTVGVAKDIEDATDEGARVINMSWGSGPILFPSWFAALGNAVEYAYKKDVVLVAAAGNSGKEIIKVDGGRHLDAVYPASYTRVLAVGASDWHDKRDSESNYGDEVIFAPGINVVSTDKDGGYSWDAGTSFSAPQVTALAALILSVKPELHNWEVIDIIKKTADVGPGLGRVNIYRALKLVKENADPGADNLPQLPSSLDVAALEGTSGPFVRLAWSPPAQDYAGVHIYRVEVDSTGHYSSLDTPKQVDWLEGGPIAGDQYDDDGVVEGKTYEYLVFSVDATGQESLHKQQEAITVPEMGSVSYVNKIDGNASAIVINENYAYAAIDSRLVVLDISSPGDPTIVGQTDPLPGSIANLAFDRNRIYVANYSNGVRILDVSVPSSPTELGVCDTPGEAYGVAVSGSYAFVADGSQKFQVCDVSVPSQSLVVGSFLDLKGFGYGVEISGNYAYVGAWNLYVLDISNAEAPSYVGSYSPSMPKGYSRKGVSIVGDKVYVGEWRYTVPDATGGGVRVIDVSTPANPTATGFYGSPAGRVDGVAVANEILYAADRAGGLRVVDVSNPSAPTEIGAFDTSGYAFDVALSGNYIFVAGGNNGLLVLWFAKPVV